MSLTVRLILIFLALFAAFWLLALVVGWLSYLFIAVGVIGVIALLVWCFRQKSASELQPLTKKHEQQAQKELQKLEKRQKNGPR
ncbi:hypothetical protein [Armatimonas sp.]|uniref:hypothetical protein n=1 Tax=Armatimonas sp. TaxID=1872638 RepID=UPI0037510D02